jgi:hypothetical protein
LFVVVFCRAFFFPFGGVIVFWMPVFGVFAWSDCSGHGFCGFCLESLILAQDERWRRA